jgi:hypothetical protein
LRYGKLQSLIKKKWFAAILVLNTAGILPILYLYVFGKKKDMDDDSIETIQLNDVTEDPVVREE